MKRFFSTLFRGNFNFELLIVSVVLATAVFWVLYFLTLVFNTSTGYWWQFFALPASFPDFVRQPWSIFTYAWIHTELVGFLINLLLLYYLGNLFLTYEPERRLLKLFFTGIVSGGIVFMLSFYLLPYFYRDERSIYLTGVSAGYVIWLAYLASKYGNYSVYLGIFGEWKIKHIFYFFLIIDLLLINSANSGGHFAHLGAMLMGWLTARFEGFRRSKVDDYSVYNNYKNSTQKKIDDILEKIGRSGYESLTEKEKEILHRESKRNS